MGYDGAMLLASILLFFPILAIAAIVFLILRWQHFVPKGRISIPAYALIALGGYALLFLYSSVQMLVINPATLQEKYLGRVYGGPLELRGYEHSGFQDPAGEWRYALDAISLADLERRCRHVPHDLPPRCNLSSVKLGRRSIDVWLEGGELHLLDANS